MLSYVWAKFKKLNRTRAVGMNVGIILPSEIIAWQTLSGESITPMEFEIIGLLDDIFLAHQAKLSKKD